MFSLRLCNLKGAVNFKLNWFSFEARLRQRESLFMIFSMTDDLIAHYFSYNSVIITFTFPVNTQLGLHLFEINFQIYFNSSKTSLKNYSYV